MEMFLLNYIFIRFVQNFVKMVLQICTLIKKFNINSILLFEIWRIIPSPKILDLMKLRHKGLFLSKWVITGKNIMILCALFFSPSLNKIFCLFHSQGHKESRESLISFNQNESGGGYFHMDPSLLK